MRKSGMNRRRFLQTAGASGLVLGSGMGGFCENLYALGLPFELAEVEARYYNKLPDREIECRLCPRKCRLGDRERGYCGVRENRNGIYYSLVYGKACAANIDPIEKKPFFHFLPGSRTQSIATAGCNVNCKFCQNWEISQVRPEQIRFWDLPPAAVVNSALENRCPVIAYTYSEPVVYYEYMVDTARAGRKKGLKNVVVTAGHILEEPLLELLETVDAVKVDLKAFSQRFYTDFVRGDLAPVLDAIQVIASSPIWLEIVYLVIPTLNDSLNEIENLCRWLASLGRDIPIHFSRFQPMYLMKDLPPTPISTLERIRNTALDAGLRFVYIGNVPGHPGEQTVCPQCGGTVIGRRAYQIQTIQLDSGKCRTCGYPIPGVWS
ncbi:MAG: AmmeMemoRadiSam system radical SAM enzyme [Candidatus Aminicenantes bacterium]|nr:AmmeMemoRadiSam system radical SAM enzyme [Candidatus Aminicenantes bacterium]